MRSYINWLNKIRLWEENCCNIRLSWISLDSHSFTKTYIWNIPRLQCKAIYVVSHYIKTFNICTTLKLKYILAKDLQNTTLITVKEQSVCPETLHQVIKHMHDGVKGRTVVVGEPITTGQLSLLHNSSLQSVVNGEWDMSEKWTLLRRFKLQTGNPQGSGSSLEKL